MSILNPILSQSDDDMLGKGIVPGAGGQDTESSILGGIKSPTPTSSLGASLDPGQQIPGSKMHQAGKDAYAQLMPKITADAGTSDYFRQRQEQLEFEKDHPNGAPISKHPGTFGTILHGIAKAGNLAGEILAPGTLENIPGTELHRDRESRELQTSQREAETQENQATQAAATKEKADTEARMADQAKPKEEAWDHFDKFTDTDGTPLLKEKNSGQIVNAATHQPPKGYKPVAPDKPGKPDTPEQQFIDSPEEASKPLSQRISDYSRLTQKPERPEKEPKGESFVDANGKVIEMKPGMTLPPGAKPLSKAGEPTADEQRRNDLATNLNENLNQLEGIVDRRPELFGPLAGRWSELKSKFGSDDPDIAALSVLEHQIGMAQISAHGMRSAHGIEGAAQSIINGLHSGPTALKGAIATVRKSVGTFQQDVANAKGEPTQNSPTQGASLNVKAPNGKTYTFKDQASADAFKKEAGIQ